MQIMDIDNRQDIVDSRDVIARIEALKNERQSLEEAVSEAAQGADDSDEQADAYREAQEAMRDWEREEGEELSVLIDLMVEAQGSPDWEYGEALIRDSHWIEYVQQLVEDCYPTDMSNSSGWPWYHLTMDWEAAAEELKADYVSVDWDGVTYWIRA